MRSPVGRAIVLSLWKARLVLRDIRMVLAEAGRQGKRARSACGKPVAAQVLEMWRLIRSYGQLEPDEYYQYCLFDDRRFTWEDKRRFLGRRLEDDFVYIFGAELWSAIANDKIITGALLEKMGMPVPRTLALFHPFRVADGMRACRSELDLWNLFKQTHLYPLVCKPIWGMWGRNVFVLERYDMDTDEVVFSNGRRRGARDFVRELGHIAVGRREISQQGLIVQERVHPHADTRVLTGDRLCSIRLVLMLQRGVPMVVASLLKLPSGENMADNYGERGNLIAGIDPASGRLGPGLTGFGLDQRAVETHPDTGARIDGTVLPDWQDALELASRAALLFPGIPMQAWDIALSDRGPILLEVNVNGGMRLPQFVKRAGLHRGAFAEFLSEFGFPGARVVKPSVSRQ